MGNRAEYGGAIYSWNSATPTMSESVINQIAGPFADQGGNVISDSCGPDCATDRDGDGMTGGADLGLVFVAWGSCPGCGADFNGDGLVNGKDLGVLFAAWGPCS